MPMHHRQLPSPALEGIVRRYKSIGVNGIHVSTLKGEQMMIDYDLQYAFTVELCLVASCYSGRKVIYTRDGMNAWNIGTGHFNTVRLMIHVVRLLYSTSWASARTGWSLIIVQCYVIQYIRILAPIEYMLVAAQQLPCSSSARPPLHLDQNKIIGSRSPHWRMST